MLFRASEKLEWPLRAFRTWPFLTLVLPLAVLTATPDAGRQFGELLGFFCDDVLELKIVIQVDQPFVKRGARFVSCASER